MNRKCFKVIFLFILIITLTMPSIFAYEGEVELKYDSSGRILIDKVTMDALIIENSTAYESLQKQMLDLQNAEVGLSYTQSLPIGFDSSGVIYGDLSEAYSSYSDLMYKEKNGQLTPFEVITLDALKGIFGEQDYDYVDYQDEAYDPKVDKTRADYFNLVYAPMVQYESVKSAVDVMQNQLLVINDQVLFGNYQLIASYINLVDIQRAQQEELILAGKLLQNEKDKYELGKISQLDFQNAEIDYKIKVQTQHNLVRSVNNLELNVKKNMGLNLSDLIIIEDFWLGMPPVDLDNFQTYLDQALENRIEIKNAQTEYDSQKIIYEYYVRAYGSSHSESIIQRQKLNTLEANIIHAKLDVQKDIYYGYHDIINRINTFDISKLKYNDALNNYKVAKASYEAGLITEVNYRYSKYGFDMANAAHQNDYRLLQIAMNKFEKAYKEGPSYGSIAPTNTNM